MKLAVLTPELKKLRSGGHDSWGAGAIRKGSKTRSRILLEHLVPSLLEKKNQKRKMSGREKNKKVLVGLMVWIEADRNVKEGGA